MTSLLSLPSMGQSLSSIEKAGVAGLGTYGLGMLVFGQGPSVSTPVGSVSANVLQAGLVALGSLFEDTTRSYIPESVKAYGSTVEGVVTRGVVPATAYSLVSGTSTSASSFGTNAALSYIGSSAGMYAYQSLTGKEKKSKIKK